MSAYNLCYPTVWIYGASMYTQYEQKVPDSVLLGRTVPIELCISHETTISCDFM